MARRRQTRRRKSSGGARVLRLLFFVLLIAAAGVAWLVFMPFGPSSETFVELEKGSSTLQMGRQLEAAGVVRSQFAFDLVRWWKRGTLKAGEYRFDHPAAVTEVYTRINHGDVYTRTVVIPEGSSLFDIAARLEQAGFGTRQSFLEGAARQVNLVADLDPQATELGGLSVSRHLSLCAQVYPGADLHGDGQTLQSSSWATGIERECTSRGDIGFASGAGDGSGCRAAARGQRL